MLREFSSLNIGKYIVTCRSNYSVLDLAASEFWISAFNELDAKRFSESFFRFFGVTVDAGAMIKDLKSRGFNSFLQHPLMLTLVCILYSSPMRSIPRSSLNLIKRAIDTLTLRWDESRGIARDSDLPLDGEERLRCLMRVAFDSKELEVSDSHIQKSVKEHLARQQVRGVDGRVLLQEISQWYGLIVPVYDGWAFVHRVIHDYMAARYWVDSGRFAADFAADKLGNWDSRAAFAMSFLPDATLYLERALADKYSMPTLVQCLWNRAVFDPKRIAKSVIIYFRHVTGSRIKELRKPGYIAHIPPDQDCFSYCSQDFLEALVLTAIKDTGNMDSNLVLAYALGEVYIRNLSLPASLAKHVIQYFGNQRFAFQIDRTVKGSSGNQNHIRFTLNNILPEE